MRCIIIPFLLAVQVLLTHRIIALKSIELDICKQLPAAAEQNFRQSERRLPKKKVIDMMYSVIIS